MARHVLRFTVAQRMHATKNEEQRKLKLGKPVERRGRKASGLRDHVLRQRGCHMSHANIVDAKSCAERRIERAHFRARIQFFIGLASLSGDDCVIAGTHARNAQLTSNQLRCAKRECEP
jgi:hypothetical protein